MLKRLYEAVIGMAGHRNAVPGLAVVSFAESSFFPIPPDVLLIPMVLAQRSRAWFYAAISTVASVLGGVLGYAIGFYLFDSVGQDLVNFYGYGDQFTKFQGHYLEWGIWIVIFFGVTPFPYKVITIASGVVAMDPMGFILASAASRGVRFYMECGLLWYFGDPIRDFIERRLGLVVLGTCLLLVGGFVVLKWVL